MSVQKHTTAETEVFETMQVTKRQQEFLHELQQLDDEAQELLLIRLRADRVRPAGTPAAEFLEKTKDLHIDPADLELMQRAIEATKVDIETLPQGISGEEAIAISREIDFPPEDLAEVEQAIEAEFGQPRGEPAAQFIEAARKIRMSIEEIEQMERAIEEAFEGNPAK